MTMRIAAGPLPMGVPEGSASSTLPYLLPRPSFSLPPPPPLHSLSLSLSLSLVFLSRLSLAFSLASLLYSSPSIPRDSAFLASSRTLE